MTKTKTKKIKRTIAGLLIVVLVGVFAAPSSALATCTTPTGDQYKLKQICVHNDTGSGGGGGLSSNVGGLPFTGLDVVAMVAVALAVTGLGLGLQRAVSRQPE